MQGAEEQTRGEQPGRGGADVRGQQPIPGGPDREGDRVRADRMEREAPAGRRHAAQLVAKRPERDRKRGDGREGGSLPRAAARPRVRSEEDREDSGRDQGAAQVPGQEGQRGQQRRGEEPVGSRRLEVERQQQEPRESEQEEERLRESGAVQHRDLGRAGHQDGADHGKPARTRRAPGDQQAHEHDVRAEQNQVQPASGVEEIGSDAGDRRERSRVEGRKARQGTKLRAVLLRGGDAAACCEVSGRLEVADGIRGDSDAMLGGVRQQEHPGERRKADQTGKHRAAGKRH